MGINEKRARSCHDAVLVNLSLHPRLTYEDHAFLPHFGERATTLKQGKGQWPRKTYALAGCQFSCNSCIKPYLFFFCAFSLSASPSFHQLASSRAIRSSPRVFLLICKLSLGAGRSRGRIGVEEENIELATR